MPQKRSLGIQFSKTLDDQKKTVIQTDLNVLKIESFTSLGENAYVFPEIKIDESDRIIIKDKIYKSTEIVVDKIKKITSDENLKNFSRL